MGSYKIGIYNSLPNDQIPHGFFPDKQLKNLFGSEKNLNQTKFKFTVLLKTLSVFIVLQQKFLSI
jgi:hypothetical protein